MRNLMAQYTNGPNLLNLICHCNNPHRENIQNKVHMDNIPVLMNIKNIRKINFPYILNQYYAVKNHERNIIKR